MPKLSSIQNFGEQFLSVIQNIKKERTEKEQFEKEMRYKFRQQNLMNTYYKGILENQVTDNILARERFEYEKTLLPEPPKTNIEGSYKNPETGTIWKWDETNQKPLDTGIPYDRKEGSITIVNEAPKTTPYVDVTKSDDAFTEYKKYTGKNVTPIDEDSFDVLGEKDALSGEDVKRIRGEKLKGLISETDNEAKRYNQIYMNFDETYQDFLRVTDPTKLKPGEKQLTKNNLERRVTNGLKGAPNDMIKAMKDLLKKRIF